MIELTDFKDFLNVVEDFTHQNLVKTKLTLKNEGIDISSLDDLFINDQDILFTFLPDGTLQRVNLYIAEQTVSSYEFDFTPKHKYHIFKCRTLVEMFNHHRKHRYKINTRIDGTFYYRYINSSGHIIKENEKEKIPLCKNCLNKYLALLGKRYNRFEADNLVKTFNLEEFDRKFGQFFQHSDFSDIQQADQGFSPNIYSKSWRKISNKIKLMKDYTCEKCGYKPKNSDEKKFIHVHHINGDKTDNSLDNLQVLCIKCHANVDKYHAQLKNSHDYQEFIKLTYNN